MPPNPEEAKRLKEWLELSDYQRGEGPYPVECWDDGPPFGKRYGRLDLAVHLHVRIEAGSFKLEPDQPLLRVQSSPQRGPRSRRGRGHRDGLRAQRLS